MRRIVPARNIAPMRSRTISTGTPERSAIVPNGSRTKPPRRSSEIARIAAFVGSSTCVGTRASMLRVLAGCVQEGLLRLAQTVDRIDLVEQCSGQLHLRVEQQRQRRDAGLVLRLRR